MHPRSSPKATSGSASIHQRASVKPEDIMHKIAIPKSVVERVIARRGRELVYDNLDPRQTALLVVDMQNAFMLEGVAHTLCPMAQEIVPNVNRLAQAVRETGGAVVWIKTTYTT